MATLYTTDDGSREVRPAKGEAFTLAQLQAFVGGDIEVVRAPTDGLYLVINEDGKRLQLPANATATRLYRAAGGVPWDVVVGDVLLATVAELGGDV